MSESYCFGSGTNCDTWACQSLGTSLSEERSDSHRFNADCDPCTFECDGDGTYECDPDNTVFDGSGCGGGTEAFATGAWDTGYAFHADNDDMAFDFNNCFFGIADGLRDRWDDVGFFSWISADYDSDGSVDHLRLRLPFEMDSDGSVTVDFVGSLTDDIYTEGNDWSNAVKLLARYTILEDNSCDPSGTVKKTDFHKLTAEGSWNRSANVGLTAGSYWLLIECDFEASVTVSDFFDSDSHIEYCVDADVDIDLTVH